jgi:hypothetical protein
VGILIEHHADIIQSVGDRAIKGSQFLPDEFLDHLKRMKDESLGHTGDTHCVASIPNLLVEKWQRQGFDVMRESAKAIVARLQAEGLDSFITSKKAL